MARLEVDITGNLSGLNKAVSSAERSLDKFASKAKSIGTTLSVAVTLPLVAIGAAAVKAGSDFEETSSKFQTVFKDISDSAKDTAKDLEDSFGLSSLAAQTLLGNTGDLLTGFGFTQRSALDLSKRVNELAVDLASFTNFSGGAEGASKALTSALLGEREAVKSLGISILEEDVKKQVAINTANGLTFETERQAKAYATLDIALRQSTNAIGDYSRTSNSFANQQRQLRAEIENIGVQIGQILLPVVTRITAAARDLAERFSNLSDRTKTIIVVVTGVAAAIGPLLLALGGLASILPVIITGFVAVTGPIGLTVAAITALTAGIVAVNSGFINLKTGMIKVKKPVDEFAEVTNAAKEAQELLNKAAGISVKENPSFINATRERALARIEDAKATLEQVRTEKLVAIERLKNSKTGTDVFRDIAFGTGEQGLFERLIFGERFEERVSNAEKEASDAIREVTENLNKLTLGALTLGTNFKKSSEEIVNSLSDFEKFSLRVDASNEKLFRNATENAEAFNKEISETLRIQSRIQELSTGIVGSLAFQAGTPGVQIQEFDVGLPDTAPIKEKADEIKTISQDLQNEAALIQAAFQGMGEVISTAFDGASPKFQKFLSAFINFAGQIIARNLAISQANAIAGATAAGAASGPAAPFVTPGLIAGGLALVAAAFGAIKGSSGATGFSGSSADPQNISGVGANLLNFDRRLEVIGELKGDGESLTAVIRNVEKRNKVG